MIGLRYVMTKEEVEDEQAPEEGIEEEKSRFPPNHQL